jgi:hypothetical protein
MTKGFCARSEEVACRVSKKTDEKQPNEDKLVSEMKTKGSEGTYHVKNVMTMRKGSMY